LAVFGLLGRAPYSMFPIGLIALVVAATDSYPLAGLTAAAFTIAMALAGPVIGRRMDRVGQRRVGLPLVAVFLAASAGLVAAGVWGAPALAFPLLAGLAGASLPNVGSIARARWSRLLADARQVDAAQALESINDEVSFLVGPAAVALLAARGPGWLPVAIAAGLAIVGVLVVLSLREPPRTGSVPVALVPVDAHAEGAGIAAELVVVAGSVSPSADTGAAHPARSTARGDWGLFLAAMVGIGTVLGANTVLILAYAEFLADPDGGALPLVVNSLGSLLAGIAVGAMTWRHQPRRRFAIACVLYAVCAVPMAVADGLIAYSVACFIAGTMIAPTLIQANAHVAVTAAPDRRMEAFSWVSSGIGVGLSLGSAVAGWLVGAVGPDAARWGAPAMALIPAVIAVAWEWRGRHAAPRASSSAPSGRLRATHEDRGGAGPTRP
jgi:MFS family permease